MNETQKRIRAYKEALPGLKERVIAVALLLAMSFAMMTSATFAWITLSRAPEVTDVTTNIAANGNLEIALAKPDGSAPGESAIGDSSAAPEDAVPEELRKLSNIVRSNVTWGNLVNLSDPSYGLENIILRPALLGDETDLISHPLKGVDYSADGRLMKYFNENYQFANWIQSPAGGYFEYKMPQQYGVRAISTVAFEYKNDDYPIFEEMMRKPTSVQADVKEAYNNMIDTKDNMDALTGLISIYIDDRFNDGNGATNAAAYIPGTYKLALELQGIVEHFGDALFELANVQIFNHVGLARYEDEKYDTTEEFFNDSANWGSKGIQIDCVDDYLAVKEKVRKVIHGKKDKEYPETMDCLSDFYDHIEPSRGKEGSSTSNTVEISKVLTVMDELVKISTTKITLGGQTFDVNGLGSFIKNNISNIGSIMNDMKDVTAEIQSGALKDFEQLTGCDMSIKARNISIKAKVIIETTIIAREISTTAKPEYLFDLDVAATKAKGAANPGVEKGVAKDTYGMAVDYWVRTNAAGSHLVLEGNLLSTRETVRATGTAHTGETVDLSTVTVTTKYKNEQTDQIEEVEDEVTVYILDGVIYNANTYQEIKSSETQTVSQPKALMTEKVTITGYEGENRVWYPELLGEDEFYKGLQLSVDSTTQGSGSCYVFYAEDPTQQENGIRLLSNLRVAFVDNTEGSKTKGKLVAHARLDTVNYYEESGKVILPLVLEDDGSAYLTKTDEGLAILPLEQNVPSRLMTLVYLDGRQISNSDVLEASEIHGQLNIQFGTTADLAPARNETLELAERKIHVAAKKHDDNEYKSNDSPIVFNYDEEGGLMEVDVRVTVEGDLPTNASAFFMRKVNATQGSRGDSFVLYETEDKGVYVGTAQFTAPGTYVLQTVVLDGTDYSVPVSEGYPTVQINGFDIETVSLAYEGSFVTDPIKIIMTDDRSVSADVAIKFKSSGKLPGSVRMQFVKDKDEGGGRVTAIMAYDTTTGYWSGTATFASSGEYTLQSVIIDNETTDLDAQYQTILDITLGLAIRVSDDDISLRNTLWEGEEYSIPMRVEIIDEGGNPVPNLSGAKLTYGVGKSKVEKMDPDLVWNAQKRHYTCNMLISGPGLYNFINVDLDGVNKLDRALNTPPEFSCTSPNPPEYFDAKPEITENLAANLANLDYVIDDLNDLTGVTKATIRLAEASSARVRAVFFNAEDNTEYPSDWVSPSGNPTDIGGKPVSEFVFTVPKTNKTPGQTGDWTIRRLELINVYANNKMYRDENDPLVMTMTHDEETNDLHVQIVSAKVTVTTGDKERAYKGSFLESKETGSITVTITDHKDRVLELPISDIALKYELATNSWSKYEEDYGGGYTADHLGDGNGTGESDTYTIKCGDDGKTFKLNAVKLTYAGIYEPTSMAFDINNGAVKYEYKVVEDLNKMGMPTFKLRTEKPTVSITAASYTGTFNADTTGVGNGHQSVTVPAFTSTSATVAFQCNRSGSGSTCDPYRHNYSRPSVTITLAGIGKGTGAELFFGSGIHLYNGTTQTTSYSWTGNGGCARNVGYYRSKTAQTDDKTPAGTLTASTLIVNNGSQQYSFTIPTITINNPY